MQRVAKIAVSDAGEPLEAREPPRGVSVSPEVARERDRWEKVEDSNLEPVS